VPDGWIPWKFSALTEVSTPFQRLETVEAIRACPHRQLPSQMEILTQQRISTLLIVVLAFSACEAHPRAPDPAANDADAVQVGDSARVTLSSTDTANILWQIDSLPSTRIGALDEGPYAFANSRGVAVATNGNIIVANGGTLEIRAFSPDGAFLWSTGREGSGPGEYKSFRSVDYCGAKIVVADLQARRITLLANDGSFISSRSWQPLRIGSAPSIVSCGASGTIAFLDRGSPASPPAGPHTVAAVIGAVSPADSAATIVADFPGIDRYRYPAMDGPADFGKTTLLSAADEEVHVVTTDEAEVRTYSVTGELRRIVRWDQALRRLTDEIVSTELEHRLQVLPAAMRPEYRRTWQSLSRPEYLPLVSALVSAENGDLWLKEYSVPGEEEQVWRVLSPGGAIRGRAIIPHDFELQRVLEGHVIGLIRDDMGVEYVEARRIATGA
jgi:hypothetical protein